MGVKRVRQGWVGRGFWSISLLSWPFEAFPALILLLPLLMLLVGLSMAFSFPVIFALDALFNHLPEQTQILEVTENLSQDILLSGSNWLGLGLATSPLLLYRSLLLPSSLNFVKLGAIYLVVASLMVVFVDTDSMTGSGSALAQWPSVITIGSGFIVFPLGLAVGWALIALASKRMRFPWHRMAPPWAYLRSLPNAAAHAWRTSPKAPLWLWVLPIVGSGPLIVVTFSLMPAPAVVAAAFEPRLMLVPWPARGYLTLVAFFAVCVAPAAILCIWSLLKLAERRAVHRHVAAIVLPLLAGLVPVVVWPEALARTDGLVWLGLGACALSFFLMLVPFMSYGIRGLSRILILTDIGARYASHSGDRTTLLLRPFSLDKIEVSRSRGLVERALLLRTAKVRLEQVVTALEFRRGRVIALGNPTEPYPEIGAMREYCTIETWQPYVLDRLNRLDWVLFIVDESRATQWEVDQILSLDGLERVTFVIGAAEAGRRFFAANPELAAKLEIANLDPSGWRDVLCVARRDGETILVEGASRRAHDFQLAYNFATA